MAVTLTVESVLELEAFARVPWTIVAGLDHLGRMVRWVHPSETPDIAHFLRGGEMLLTAGTGIGADPDDQRAYVRALAEAGAAVLVLELSDRAFPTMPPALVEEANRQGLPVVGLKGEIPFVEVSAQVHERLMEERVAELTGHERFNNSLMEALRSGADYVTLADLLAGEACTAVVLEDATHRVMAHAGSTATSDAVVTDWDQHARVSHRADATVDCIRRAVSLPGDRWGWIHLLHGGSAFDATTLHALERTADAVAISILGARESHARTIQRESVLVNRLMLGDITGEAFIARALKLGKDLRRRRLVAVWTEGDRTDPPAERLKAAGQKLKLTIVTADAGDAAVAVCGLRSPRDPALLRDFLGSRPGVSGISRICGAADLGTAVRQAKSAAAVATNQIGPSTLLFDELGVLRLLVPLAQGPELAHYVEDELGALLSHDASSSHPLLPTLRTFVACGGNKSNAAAELHVQRRTLYYRLERISSLLNKDLDDPESVQAVTFAVRALDLLRDSPRPG